MQYTTRFYRVDEHGNITHRALSEREHPDNIKWCPIKRAHVEFEIEDMRLALQMFDTCTRMWTVPDTQPPFSIDFGNVRQILNPHGGGTHTCKLGGAAHMFIESILELPRFQDCAGNIYLCGIDFIDGNDPKKGKQKPPPEPQTVDEILADDERRECGFTRGIARFNAYVEWIGKHTRCGGAAQGVVLAVGELVLALRECGINHFANIDKAICGVVKSLEDLCRALADAEPATGVQRGAPIAPAQPPITKNGGAPGTKPKRKPGRPRKPDGAAHFIFTPERKEAAVQIIGYRRNNPKLSWIQCAEKVAEENPNANEFENEKNFMAWASSNGTTRTELEHLSSEDWEAMKQSLK